MPKPVTPIVSATPTSPDPRVGLKAGWWDAGQAAWNMRMVSTTPPTEGKALGATHSDLAFSGNLAIMGNYDGFEIYDISKPAKPVLVQSYLCPASQNDVSVYKNLLFMSSEATNSRADCGFGGVPDPISKDRVRGIRIFDITDIKKPRLVTSVQTCRGSHTHTVVPKLGDDTNVFIYVSGTAGVRSADEVPGCMDGGADDPNTARFRLEVIKVPMKAPVTAAIVSSPRIFQGLPVPPKSEERDASDARDREAAAAAAAARGEVGRGRGRGNAPQTPSGPNQCHDITVYPEIGLAGGACAGLGLLLDIRDPEHPVRIDAVADANMSFWHSATFNNDGTKILFSDEWGGGGQPRCRATDKLEWGSDALFTIDSNRKMKFHSLLQAAGAADPVRELRGAQRLADPDSRPRRDGAGLVSGRPVGVRLDRHRPPEGDRLLRSRPGRRDAHGDGRLVVGLLVQRRHRQLGDCARDGHLRAPAERPDHRERDRRREDGADAVLEHPGSAEVRVGAELRARPRLPRPARALERARRRRDRIGARGAGDGRAALGAGAKDRADRARVEARGGRQRRLRIGRRCRRSPKR